MKTAYIVMFIAVCVCGMSSGGILRAKVLDAVGDLLDGLRGWLELLAWSSVVVFFTCIAIVVAISTAP